ncbi:MAG: hypothetical protein AAF799_14185 [Myxococcota bacterium]
MGVATGGLLWGCTPDTSSAGSGAGPNVGESTDSPTTTSTPGSTGSADPTTAATSDGTTSGATATSTVGPADSSSGGEDATEDSGTDGPPICTDEPETAVLWAEDGVVADGMQLQYSKTLDRQFAWSGQPDQGTLTLEFELECDGPVFFWGLVWDFAPGFDPPNADSYSISIDGSDIVPWVYGCDTVGGRPGGSWYWLEVGAFQDMPCELARLEVPLTAGPHTVVVSNREPGMDANTAAIAGLVYSHDPDIDAAQFLPL